MDNPVEGMIGNFISSDSEIFVNYIAIVEVVNGEGNHGLRMYCSDTMTPWLGQGMLYSGLEMILDSTEESEDES